VSDKLIRLKPAPSDAELEAERDRKHAIEVERWLAAECVCGHDRHDTRCQGESFDPYYGVFACLCPTYRPAT